MPNADPSLSVAERVDAACDAFEREWRAGRNPRVEDYVAAAPESDREALSSALRGVEAELRSGRGAGETSVSKESARTGSHSPAPTVQRPSEQSAVPNLIGRFEVRKLLGAGAFGRVYRAFDPSLDRDVAVKVPIPDALRTAADRDRFLKEARAAATVAHPNVCQIHEVGEHDGQPYIVMALVPGHSLAEAIRGRAEPLPEKQAAIIVRKLALALEAAHKKGVVHRDLKPANVMFDKERKDLVVMDFGLARRPTPPDARDTQSGIIMGTPAYMSPEQARGEAKEVGPAGDIFSLGIMMYELLTGSRPFTGSAHEVIGRIIFLEPEPPSAVRRGISPVLEAACMKALAKDPAKRFASMREFAAAIDAYLRKPASASAETARAVETIPEEIPDEDAAGLSTNTRKLAEVFEELSVQRKRATAETAAAVENAVVRAVKKSRPPLWKTAGLVLATVVPVVVLFAGGIVFYLKNAAVKVTVKLTDVDLKDKSLSYFLEDTRTAKVRELTAQELADPVPLKPGNYTLTVKRGKDIVKQFRIVVTGWPKSGIEVEELTPPPAPEAKEPPPKAKQPELKPSPLDDLRAADIPDDVLTKMFGDRSKAPRELVAVYTNLLTDPKDGDVFWGFSLSSNGRILASSHYPWTIIEMHDLATGKKFGDAATKPGGWVTWAKISPDNKSVYFIRTDDKIRGSDIGGQERWTLPTRDKWTVPALSPDGATLIMGDGDTSSRDLLVIDAQTGETRATWKNVLDAPQYRISYSPDGKAVAVRTGSKLKYLSAKDGKPLDYPVIEKAGGEPKFSGDGKKVYTSHSWKEIEDYCVEYEVATGKRVEYRLAPKGCRDMIPNPAFPLLATHDNARYIHVWDANAGPDQKPYLIDLGDRVERFAWTPEGHYLVVGSRNRILVLRLPVDKPLRGWKEAR